MYPFHLAFPVDDIEATKSFYINLFDVKIGREAKKWVDFNFYGHQLSAHLTPRGSETVIANEVDGKKVPTRHFGVVLDWGTWHTLADKLKQRNTEFVIEPYIRFRGETGEQATMFLLDPSGNALEFKSFKDPEELFAVE